MELVIQSLLSNFFTRWYYYPDMYTHTWFESNNIVTPNDRLTRFIPYITIHSPYHAIW